MSCRPLVNVGNTEVEVASRGLVQPSHPIGLSCPTTNAQLLGVAWIHVLPAWSSALRSARKRNEFDALDSVGTPIGVQQNAAFRHPHNHEPAWRRGGLRNAKSAQKVVNMPLRALTDLQIAK